MLPNCSFFSATKVKWFLHVITLINRIILTPRELIEQVDEDSKKYGIQRFVRIIILFSAVLALEGFTLVQKRLVKYQYFPK